MYTNGICNTSLSNSLYIHVAVWTIYKKAKVLQVPTNQKCIFLTVRGLFSREPGLALTGQGPLPGKDRDQRQTLTAHPSSCGQLCTVSSFVAHLTPENCGGTKSYLFQCCYIGYCGGKNVFIALLAECHIVDGCLVASGHLYIFYFLFALSRIDFFSL